VKRVDEYPDKDRFGGFAVVQLNLPDLMVRKIDELLLHAINSKKLSGICNLFLSRQHYI
jgi:hypothetical protein